MPVQTAKAHETSLAITSVYVTICINGKSTLRKTLPTSQFGAMFTHYTGLFFCQITRQAYNFNRITFTFVALCKIESLPVDLLQR